MSIDESVEVCQKADKGTRKLIYKALRKFPRSFAVAAAELDVSTGLLSRWLRSEVESAKIESKVALLLGFIDRLNNSEGAVLLPQKKKRRWTQAQRNAASSRKKQWWQKRKAADERDSPPWVGNGERG